MGHIISDATQQLVAIATEADVAELDVCFGGLRIAVRRTPQPASAPAPAVCEVVHVTAPMVGTFRRMASDGAHVLPGQPLGHIHALGLSVEIPAPVSGRLRQFLVADGEPVEYGQTLCAIHLDHSQTGGAKP